MIRMVFCEHMNLQDSCKECNPERYKRVDMIEEGEECPVWYLLQKGEQSQGLPQQCQNSGVKVVKVTAKQVILECTSCGWEWKRWKGGRDAGGMPKLVHCSRCGNTRIERQERTSDSTCLDCGRAFLREKKPNYFRDIRESKGGI